MNIKTKDITSVALGVAVLIAGGYLIYLVGKLIPFPGFKYMMMAPYLSLIMYVMQHRIKSPQAFLFIGVIFASIMGMVNIFMGMAIITTTLLSYLSSIAVADEQGTIVIRSILFSGFTGLTSLVISKYLIGGIFENLQWPWMIGTGIVCSAFGALGIILGKKIVKHLNAIYDNDQ